MSDDERQVFTCKDCGENLVKGEIEMPDFTWVVGYFCICQHGDPGICLHMWNQHDWTGKVLIEAAKAEEEPQ